jgi:Putative polyhydroxyalkanoic acid system protein (PHA_gran_rgn)
VRAAPLRDRGKGLPHKGAVIVSAPIVVTVSHQLGKEEALRRLQNGLTNLTSGFGPAFKLIEQTSSGDDLDFRISAFGQAISGQVRVADDHIRLQLSLPWLLAKLAGNAHAMIQRQSRLMLEKK